MLLTSQRCEDYMKWYMWKWLINAEAWYKMLVVGIKKSAIYALLLGDSESMILWQTQVISCNTDTFLVPYEDSI
jgi:hypothetical protein